MANVAGLVACVFFCFAPGTCAVPNFQHPANERKEAIILEFGLTDVAPAVPRMLC
jgi:hypothetical protein